MPGKRCSNCITFELDCAYIDGTQKEYSETYVEDLERKVQEREKILLQMIPDGGFNSSRFTSGAGPKHLRASDPDKDITAEINSMYLQDPDEQKAEWYKDIKLGCRFFGKSSSAQFIEAAMKLKQEYSGNTRAAPPFLSWKRPEFWDSKPPDQSIHAEVCHDSMYVFPEDDLFRSLVDLYFARVNILVPLLHRPTFDALIADKVHLEDQEFAQVVMLVCAVASRYSDDPRVLFDGQPQLRSWQSSGWKWVHQVVRTFRFPMTSSTLYGLQFICLFSQFMLGSSAASVGWTLAGIGLRLAQEAGIHQRQATGSTPNTVEGELWKRAFWCLMFIDRVVSSHLGRPCALYDEETDVELPVECDDQYWIPANPEQEAFKQPAGQPSDISYFNSCLRLSRLLLTCLRTLYLMKKSKMCFGLLDQDWDRRVAAELDSSLDSWFDSVPKHLRWDPNQENSIRFNQSASLYILYFQLRILIHRPFIISSSNSWAPIHMCSLVICLNAARSCSSVIDAQRIRGHIYPISGFIAFNAGVVLLFNIWYQRHFDHSFDASHDIDNVHKCMEALEHLNT